MGVEPTTERANAPSTVLKTEGLTGAPALSIDPSGISVQSRSRQRTTSDATTIIAPITTHSGRPYITALGRSRRPWSAKTVPAISVRTAIAFSAAVRP